MNAIINLASTHCMSMIDMQAFTTNNSIRNQSQPRAMRGAVTSLMDTHPDLHAYMEVHHAWA